MEYRFADCVLDTGRLTLLRGGKVQAVEPQVFDLLRLLAENAGRVVTRDEIVETVWQGRIVSESAISARIAAARKAVGDDGKRQAVIRTVSRRGLMFVAEVAGSPPAPAASGSGKPPVQRIRFARNADGHKLAYAVSGDGTPLLRFPPPLTIDLEIEWNNPVEHEYIGRLADHFSYLRFDHLGSGQSERVEPNYDFAKQADDAAAVADAAGFDRFAAWSMSGGVLTAINFAARYPDRLTRLAIVGGYVDGRSRRGARDAPDSLKTMIAEGWGKTDNAFATAFMTSYFPDGPLEDVRSLVSHMQAACPPDIMLKDRDAINNASIAELLPEVRCPVMILHARDGAVHPLSEARKLAAGIPDAELVILETANHVPYPGNPVWETYMETLLGFLSENP